MVQAGNHAVLNNWRGLGSLTGYVAELYPLVWTATGALAAQAEVMFQSLHCADIGQALPVLPNSGV